MARIENQDSHFGPVRAVPYGDSSILPSLLPLMLPLVLPLVLYRSDFSMPWGSSMLSSFLPIFDYSVPYGTALCSPHFAPHVAPCSIPFWLFLALGVSYMLVLFCLIIALPLSLVWTLHFLTDNCFVVVFTAGE